MIISNLHNFIEPGRAEKNAVRALDIILECKSVDGAHHKDWLLDQVVRELTGKNYEALIAEYEAEYEDGGEIQQLEWDTGIAP